MPVVIPVTTPVLEIAARLLVALHEPPVVLAVNAVVAPGHTVVKPVIAPALGNGFTVTAIIAVALPQPLATA